MSASATITAKGQFTLPKEIRDHLGLRAGDRVEFVLVEGQAILIPRNRPMSSVFGRLEVYGQQGTSLADYDAAVGSGISDHLDDQGARTGRDAA